MERPDTSDVQLLASYVPYNVLSDVGASREPLSELVEARFQAAVLFTDISGFTAISEALALQPSGAEDLSRLLNERFGRMIDVISAHGGHVVDFIGDAVIALWPVLPARDLERSLEAATRCALVLRNDTSDDADSLQLTSRFCISCGEVWTAILNRVEGKSYWLESGEPIDAVRAMESGVEAGEVVVTDRAWQEIRERFTGSPTGTGDTLVGDARDTDYEPAPAGTVPAPPFDLIRPYLPTPVLESMHLGKLGWLAELRFMVVGFINLGKIEHAAEGSLREIRDLLVLISREVSRTGGVIWEVVADAGGLVVMMAWGLIGSTHEDDRSRSLICGRAILDGLSARGRTVSIGIAAGRGFCGDRGNYTRREYALIGNTVNRAARLMAMANHEVLCDPEVARADSTMGQMGLELVPVGVRTFKGIDEPFEVFRAEPRAAEQGRVATTLIGRTAEKDVIDAALAGGEARCLVLEGEPGVGKSTLLEYARTVAERTGLVSLHGSANSVERLVGYHPWRNVMLAATGLLGAPRPEREADLVGVLGKIGESVDYAPLLNLVFSTSFTETDVTRPMQSEGRAQKTDELLLGILGSVDGLRVLFLEDGHWFDTSSIALLKKVSRQLPHILVFLTTRPLTEAVEAEYAQLLESPHTHRLPVAPMSASDTEQLVLDHFRCTAVNPELLAFICQHGNGNPFQTKELIQILGSQGHIRKHNGFLSSRTDIHALKELIPTRVENVVSARMDILAPDDQLVLKIASVINYEFSTDVLRHIDPLERSPDALAGALTSLVEQEFLIPLADAGRYRFRHEIIERVAYEKLLFSQRRELHAAAAGWFETNHGDARDAVLSVLAHHYARAEIPDKALAYSDLAGSQALRNNANQEALQLLSRAREISEAGTTAAESPEEKAQRLEALSEVLFRIGRQEDSEDTVRTALAELGHVTPGNQISRFVGLLGLAGHQVGVRVLKRSASKGSDDGSWPLVYRLYDRYARTAYMRMDVLSTLYATAAALRSAERIGPSVELARAYASVCAASGIVPLHGVASSYQQRALATTGTDENLRSTADIHQLIGLYGCGIGDWENAYENLDRARALYQRVSDQDSYNMCMEMQAANYLHQGRFAELSRLAEEMLATAERDQAWNDRAWASKLLIQCQLVSNADPAELLKQAELNYELEVESNDTPGNVAITTGLIAVMHLRLGNPARALDRAREAVSMIEQFTGSFYGTLVAYRHSFEALIECWHLADEAGISQDVIATLIQRDHKQIKRFAKVYPIAEALELRARGCISHMKGDVASATARWRSSLEMAEAMALEYDVAQAHRLLSRTQTLAEAERERHGRRAHELFESFALR